MMDYTDTFGKNAGKVWNALNKHGPLSTTSLLKNTRLTENDLFAAIGWLARENKVTKVGTKYQLGETNLTDIIGTDAGKIWSILNTNQTQTCDLPYIVENKQIPVRDAYSALGWLARENKIQIVKDRLRNSQYCFKLK